MRKEGERMSWKNNIWGNRVCYKGPEERLPDVEAALEKKNMDRRTMYLILKYFEINPECEETLKREFPDV